MYENGELKKQKGYVCFYERNYEMQEYMLERRERKPIESPEKDKVMKSIRSIIQEKEEMRQRRKNSVFLYGISSFMAVVVLVIGINLLNSYEKMKKFDTSLSNIALEISNISEKEKSIQRTEYEKLLYQINPHFLLNTLNSVQWMARMSRQDNITEFVQRLKRLLAYNLGKEGMQTTLRIEIDIVKDYIALEQMRYDFVIEMNVEEGRYLEQPTVRMLLQPLVENAIRYGLGDDEKITIQVFEDNIRGLAIITILDSGNGLTQEEINQINEPIDYEVKKMQHGNRGIGLRYVKAMLQSFYEGETNLFVNCKKGYGTKITILIPIQEELRNKIKFTGSETEKEGMKK